jgi:DNA-binding NarL/FixJ family response regulator
VGIRVVLADDSVIVREGIQQMLAVAPQVEVVATCDDAGSVLRAVEDLVPDVLITDIRMPPSHVDEGIRLATGLRTSHPGVGVVVLSQYADPTYVLKLFESGSDGRAYLLKERVSDRLQLVSAIEAVASGGSVIDPKIVEMLVSARSVGRRGPLDELTPRELEVLAAIAQGKSNAAISDALVLSKRAVEKHINAIFLKLNLSHSATSDDINPRVKATLLYLAEADERQPTQP